MDKANLSQQPLPDSQSRQAALPSDQDRLSRVTKWVSIMAACYRRDDAIDPEIYAGAMASVLMEYPIEIVEHVMDPRTGIPRKLKWLPSIAEVADACDAAKEAQRKARMPAKPPLVRTPPTKVNPNMWANSAARERHEREYTAQANWRPGEGGGFVGLGKLLARVHTPTGGIEEKAK
jgi:hypothetical protein